MTIITRTEFRLGSIIVRYQAPAEDHAAVGLAIFPADRLADCVPPRDHLDAPAILNLPSSWLPVSACEVDPLVHLHRLGEVENGGYSQGRTLRGGPATRALKWQSQSTETAADGTVTIHTVLADGRGLECVHTLRHSPGSECLEICTTARNAGTAPLTLGLLTSFSLGALTPFACDDAPGRLWVHRVRSTWSGEGRAEVSRVEDLHLEPSWSGHGVQCKRFGQLGSMPVNGYFPFLAIEDRVAGVIWAAQLAHPGSWQMEIYRHADQLAISGGQADREFGHWTKTLAPGETFTSPTALLTVASGSLATACESITRHLARAVAAQTPAVERSLPVVFNEWCTSWGNPSHDNLLAIADRLRGTGVQYLVIDDGWAQRPGPGIQQNGDWIINEAIFPRGLRATADAIRERDLIPGIWFEFEVINTGAKAWSETAHQLHRDGVPLQVGNRRFWDFRDPWVHSYLTGCVTNLLRDNGIGYLKVDYNDTIGFGCDGPESPGENLRQHLAGVQQFFQSLRTALPDLVIENCSSGGHRLEPSMMALTAMSSSTDAHETPDIPLISAHLLQLIPASQNQIWAVIRPTDTPQRVAYSLAAAFLGRMCLSGDVHSLDDTQWSLLRVGITFYNQVAPIIAVGSWTRHGEWSPSYRHLTGWQIVICHAPTLGRTLVVWHQFGGPATTAEISLPATAAGRIIARYSDLPDDVQVTSGKLTVTLARPESGGVILLAD